ncbi:CDP-glycerol glycerophosphotransferase family protein [Aciduricibacillus chroicocephali]|uniref:CDP-glycerol glycerophosphotransferase family protein n=1 Tax=Aciduricibacillus chroicocephali TaxID=3054939 RepID=A0ABY9KYX4_9BACI|nr:CDP-glycerol glycerophosphotransferase family protein [Bacillaceae bacterium 44XB]
MFRELVISIYLFFCRVLFIIFRILPLRERTVLVASFPENNAYVAEALARKTDEEIHILCTFPLDKLQLKKSGRYYLIQFSLRNPFRWLNSMRLIATSRTVFVDNYFGWLAAKPFRSGVRCVQLWHAAGAIKRFGLKDSSIERRSPRAHRRFRKVYDTFTHIVCGSEKMADIFKDAFDVDDSRLLRTGVPRTDFFFNGEALMRSNGRVRATYDLPDKQIILYAPTYRDEELQISKLAIDLKAMEKALGDTHVLLLRLHPAVEVDLDVSNEGFVRNVSSYPDISELLAAADILISDYSSIPFEYALLGRPMIFHAYDLVDYEHSRGFWENYESLVPGPVVAMTEEIIREIRGNDFDFERITHFSSDWNTYSNGHSSEQLIDYFYEQEKQQNAAHL